GFVVGTNVRFPLRPVVAVETDSAKPNGHEKREIDLSMSPLVSIIETLEAPDVARVSFTSGLPADRRSNQVPTVSDQFASLLENLDALASAIQGVVESRTAGVAPDADRPTDGPGRSAAQEAGDATFEKEVVGLFALEAREWLAQIHSAMKRLSEGVNGAAKPKLYGIILQGLTNLARSASTVHLTSIEEMALKLLPTLHDVGRQDPRAMAGALASLESGLQRISAAVRHAEGAPPTEQRPEPFASPTIPAAKADPPMAPMRMASGSSLLTALRELQHVRSRSVAPARDVLDAVILRAEQEGADITIDGIRRILDELDRMDERFVDEVSRRIPAMSRILASLLKEGATDFVTSAQLAPLIEQVEALHDASEAVQAGMITMFLQGLRAFLTVAAYRKTTTLAQRLAAVESRIQSLVPMAEQWVSIGRVERAAIAEILPAG
ncbi:MAG TPA: hypothetical protein VFR79_04950, partial [Nitrospira sp.]|nr:hypothetical protein [Nitrospira sp.]